MSNAWECPRCNTINAPFNPACFCKPIVGSSERISVAGIVAEPFQVPRNAPNHYDWVSALKASTCSVCGNMHAAGADCSRMGSGHLNGD